jgi:CheY-like chemotaxis protein
MVPAGMRKELDVDNGAGLAGHRILIVEDEFLLAMELEALLEGRGCMVLGPVATIDRALAVLDDQRPAVAILDLNLKGERSTPVAAALQTRGVPFVLLTGYTRAQSSEPELEGAPRLDKPVHSKELVSVLAQVLGATSPS